MLLLLKLLQSLARTLHSEGTPTQIAAGLALGAALGLTPLFSPHNLLVVSALALLNVSFGAGMLGMTLFAPFGFALDPVFDRVGNALLIQAASLRPLWEFADGTPVLALLNLNNTVVAGSIAGWLVLFVPIFLLARLGVLRYRATIGSRVQQSRAFQAVRASRIYTVYRWFRE
ncbi:MAG TPA: TIGR03546 family protein [Gemmatimonadaceae bacterium]|nr:TIGR03546 family protein [Gemmatimonadaceae bacterium]